jgi:hypothetical protein
MKTRAIALPRVWESAELARLVLLMGIGIAISAIGMPQAITGPLVNALLILTVLSNGVSQAILVGMVTPLGAALSGILPLPLWVMIPFIALGNALFVSVFGALQTRNRWLALGAAAFVKFACLYAMVSLLAARPLHLIIGGVPQAISIPAAIAAMMSWPQLATALAGGVIAFGIAGIGKRLAHQ